VAVAPATGGGGATFRVDPPIAWSPTGDVLATGGGKLWTVEGERAGRLFAGVGGQWAWSPTANCAIQASEEGLVVSSIHGPDKLLTSIGALDFTISPDGTRVAWIHAYDDGSASLLFGNLRKGTIREGLPPVDEGTIALRGWAPDGVTVLYSIEGERPGEALLGVAGGEGPEPYSGDEVVPSSDSLSDCGSELLGVVGPSRGPNAENRLALLSAGEEPDDLTGTGFVYASPSCSADGAYAVAVRAPSDGGRRRLVLLQVGGGSESILTTGNYADEHAEWADAWSAALVVRKAPGREPEVWFLEGSTAQPIGVTLDPAVAYYGSPSWSVVLDWTATAPTGAPSG
jgi:Tol biopolymer transport system component